MTAPMFKRMALLGVGLIGGSMSHAARRGGLVGEVVGHAKSERTRARAVELGLCAKMYDNPADAARDADLVVLATPVGAYAALAAAIAPVLKPGTIVTDVGSVKAAVVADVAPHIPPGVDFVPAHPVAGTEHSGPDAGFAELFDNRWTILTPPEGTNPAAVEKLATFWRALGALVDVMTPPHHDLVLAVTSHLPHLIAYNIVGTANHLEAVTESEVIKYAAGGFRDFTRIAASDPIMWRDIFLTNGGAVLEMLGRFQEDLSVLTRAIRFKDGETLEKFFTHTRAIRRSVIDAGQADPETAKKK